MLKKMYGIILSGVLMAVSPFANSATVDEVANALNDARANLLQMINTTDQTAQKTLKAKVDVASKVLDAALEALLADKAMSADKIEQLKIFKDNWEAFKTTRETEIVPAVFAGKVDIAKAIAKGVQAERMQKMKAALGALGWKNPESK
ncbi:MAG: hypothetical protein RIT27_2049 [Pseudomonadota bacterium]|jgi:methyl-accepting chemotaxis protein WspA